MPSVLAVLYFSLFRGLDVRPNKLIYSVGASTFGVYLIHNNEQLKDFMWYKVLKITDYVESPLFIVYSLFCMLAIFAVCSAIEILRVKFIEKPLFSSAAVNKLFKKADELLNKPDFTDGRENVN